MRQTKEWKQDMQSKTDRRHEADSRHETDRRQETDRRRETGRIHLSQYTVQFTVNISAVGACFFLLRVFKKALHTSRYYKRNYMFTSEARFLNFSWG